MVDKLLMAAAAQRDMNNKLIGIIGIVWGGLIIVNWFNQGTLIPSAAFGSGRLSSVVFGVVLFAVGALYLSQKRRE